MWSSRRSVSLLVLGALFLLMGCEDVKIVKPDRGEDPNSFSGPRAFNDLGFEEVVSEGGPRGWIVESRDYLLELDMAVKRSGNSSGRLRHIDATAGSVPAKTEEEPDRRWKSDVQAEYCADADSYRGSVVQVSGFLIVQGGFASMVVRAESEETGLLHVSTDDIPSTQEWTESVLFAYLPKDSTKVCISFTLRNVGSVWADDFAVEKVEQKRLDLAKVRPIPLDNLDMEAWSDRNTLSSWTLRGKSRTKLIADRELKHSGTSAARVQYLLPEGARPERQFLSDSEYCTDPGPFLNTVVRLRGWVRTETRPGAHGYIRLRAQAGEGSLTMVLKGILKTSGWARHELIASVAGGVTKVCFAFGLAGVGRVWADDFSVETLEF